MPIEQSRVARPLRHPLVDESSFMATTHGHTNRHFGPYHDDDAIIINNDAAARNLDSDVESSSEDRSELSNEQPPEQPEEDWFATLLFAIDVHPIPLQVNWNDYESMHNDAVGARGIPRDNLFYLHHVRTPPQDLVDAGVEALTGHRFGD